MVKILFSNLLRSDSRAAFRAIKSAFVRERLRCAIILRKLEVLRFLPVRLGAGLRAMGLRRWTAATVRDGDFRAFEYFARTAPTAAEFPDFRAALRFVKNDASCVRRLVFSFLTLAIQAL
jgi:hypothetical protein